MSSITATRVAVAKAAIIGANVANLGLLATGVSSYFQVGELSRLKQSDGLIMIGVSAGLYIVEGVTAAAYRHCRSLHLRVTTHYRNSSTLDPAIAAGVAELLRTGDPTLPKSLSADSTPSSSRTPTPSAKAQTDAAAQQQLITGWWKEMDQFKRSLSNSLGQAPSPEAPGAGAATVAEVAVAVEPPATEATSS
jgi:hypothetical protein